MRVLHVIPSVALAHGGPSYAIRTMESALAERGVCVEVATTDDDGPGRRQCVALGVPVSDGGSVRWYFRKNSEFYKVSLSFVPWLLRHIRHYDVVHIHALFSFTSVAAAWAAKRAGVPYVIRPLGVLARYGVTQRRPMVKRLSLRWVEGPLLRNASAVHFTSEAEREEASMLGIELRPVVIPLGIPSSPRGDPDRFLAARPALKERFRLLYLSRLDRKKNLEGLIRALAQLRRRGHQPALMVGGDGEPTYTRQLRTLADTEGVSDQVHWLGHVTGDLKADVLSAADAFVLPSHSENFGIAAVEALMAGLPCILGHGVAIAAAVQTAGAGLATKPDPSSIAAAIEHYLQAQGVRESAGRAAAELAQREYSLAHMGQELVALYDAVSQQTGRTPQPERAQRGG